MSPSSTEDVARLVGVHRTTLERWLREKRIPKPKPFRYGRQELRLWTDVDIQRLKVYKSANYNKKPRRHLAGRKKVQRTKP